MPISRLTARLICLLLLAIPAWAEQAALKTFILAGQSNMVGQGKVADLPPEQQQAQANVLVLSENAWVPLNPAGQQQFGPEIAFGPALAKRIGQPIGIIKVAFGGTNLAKQWSPDAPATLYAKLIAAIEQARKSRPISIEGMLWMQGESDARDETMAAAYGKNLTHLIASCRRDFGGPNMPFVFGRVNPAMKSCPFVDVVRRAQEAIAIPRVRMVDCDAFSKRSDKVHYDSKGQLELGTAFAAAMIEIAKEKPARK